MSSTQMIMSRTLQRLLNLTGSILAIFGVAFVIFRLRSFSLNQSFSVVNSFQWFLIVGLAALYGLNNMFLANAWRHILSWLGVSVTLLASTKIYGISQLSKYVPGNIFHLAGRQALGMAAGMSGALLLKSSIWEIGLLALSGALFSALILPLVMENFHEAYSLALFLGSTALVATILSRIGDRHAMLAFACHVLFLASSALIFAALFCVLSADVRLTADDVLTMSGAFVVAWLVGFLTPGAPAGVGVREVILLMLLKGLVDEADLLLTILLGRLVTLIGDALFFLFASAIGQNVFRKRQPDA